MEEQHVPYVGEDGQAPLTRWLAAARVKRVLPFLHGDVLELGCGASYILRSETALNAISSYTGIEALAGSISSLRKNHPQSSFVAADLDSAHWPIEGQFDCVLALAVVEHLWNLKNLFQQARDHLKKDGIFVLTTPTPWGNNIILKCLSYTRLVRGDVIDDHVTIFNKQLFQHVCSEFGFGLMYYRRFQFGGNQLAVIRKH